MILNVVILFYPTLNIPYYNEVKGEPYHEQHWDTKRNFTFTLYTSTSPYAKDIFNKKKQPKPIWKLENWSQQFSEQKNTINVSLPKSTRRNGTLYLHSFITEVDKSPNQFQENHDPLILYSTTPLTKYLKFMPNITKNLLSDENDSVRIEDLDNMPIITHFKSKIQLELIIDRTRYPKDRIPNDILPHLPMINPERREYLPIFYFNEIGLRRDHYIPLNQTLPPKQIEIEFGFRLANLGMFRIHQHFSNAFIGFQSEHSPIKISDKDVDNMRQMFFEVSPTLLALTMLASLLHMLFDFLAFKADVTHWRNKGSLAGASKSAIIMSSLSSTLTVLYLFDQRKDTSNLILGGSIVSALVEFYKLYRVFRLRQKDTKKISKKEKEFRAKAEKEATEVDQLVLKYTLLFSIPLVAAYAIYTLKNYKYVSFYSWGLEAVMALTYLLGFINMLPQVVINYRVKSVEAVPLSAFFYKAINTFVDDLFVMVIPMPTLARLAAFRDDLIFFVFLYQWYKYPSRALEEDVEVEKKEQ
ncbi:cleft lip and palate transmembrane 1 [Neoconidiobolus thromboides FSU 785]|nr:cleft lip and palate transmembrane 1 [Neoconidiobolus thromboides FSU 785]